VKALLEFGKLAKPGNSYMTVNPLGSQLQFFRLRPYIVSDPAKPPRVRSSWSRDGRAMWPSSTCVSLEQIEGEHIRQVLANTSSLEEAAQVLMIDPSTLYRKQKRIGL